MEYVVVIIRSILFYIIITLAYRFMGKREVGELSVMDFIVSLFIAELAAISIENYKDDMLLSILPIVTLVLIQFCVAYISLKVTDVRKTVDGEVSVIINRGKINFEEMLKQRYNLDDLLTQLRSQSIKSIEEVDYAILETSGKLSVFKREDDPNRTYPLPVILDGKVQEDVLIQIRKDINWLNRKLDEENFKLEDIFYGFYQKNRLFLIKRENIK